MGKRILMTGATGFVGSFLATALMKKGHKLVLLARQSRNKSAQQRVEEVLEFVSGGLKRFKGQYAVVEGDVTNDNLGLGGIIDEPGKIDAVFHVAAALDFLEENRESVFHTNLTGTRNVLEFCSARGIRELHHASTLFVAGDQEGTIMESDLDCGQSFINPYEESKLAGEKAVHEWALKDPRNSYRIYRLPVVCGDSDTGMATAFNSFYGFFASFWTVKQQLVKRLAKNGRGLDDSGISLGADGTLHLPLTVRFSSSSSPLDLVPVDWVVKYLVQLFETEASKDLTFHFAHDVPPKGIDIARACFAMIGVKGISIVDEWPDGAPPRHHHTALRFIQKNVDHLIGRYTGYTKNHKTFDTTNLRAVMGDAYEPPPAIDALLLARLMRFAMKHNFKNLF